MAPTGPRFESTRRRPVIPHVRATASMTRMTSSKERPCPPYSRGMAMPIRPSSTSVFTFSHGYSSRSSQPAARSRNSPSASVRPRSCRSRCSLVKGNFTSASSGVVVRGEIGPELVRASFRYTSAQCRSPMALRPELRAPRPEAPGGEVQAMLVGESDGAVHLVCNPGPEPSGLAYTNLGGCDLTRRVAALGRSARMGSRHPRCRRVAGQHCELMLNRLEGADGPAELLAFRRIADGLREDRLQRSRHLRRA